MNRYREHIKGMYNFKDVALLIAGRKKPQNCQGKLSDLGTNVPNYKIFYVFRVISTFGNHLLFKSSKTLNDFSMIFNEYPKA